MMSVFVFCSLYFCWLIYVFLIVGFVFYLVVVVPSCNLRRDVWILFTFWGCVCVWRKFLIILNFFIKELGSVFIWFFYFFGWCSTFDLPTCPTLCQFTVFAGVLHLFVLGVRIDNSRLCSFWIFLDFFFQVSF